MEPLEAKGPTTMWTNDYILGVESEVRREQVREARRSTKRQTPKR